jgi:hypothetical protein
LQQPSWPFQQQQQQQQQQQKEVEQNINVTSSMSVSSNDAAANMRNEGEEEKKGLWPRAKNLKEEKEEKDCLGEKNHVFPRYSTAGNF